MGLYGFSSVNLSIRRSACRGDGVGGMEWEGWEEWEEWEGLGCFLFVCFCSDLLLGFRFSFVGFRLLLLGDGFCC